MLQKLERARIAGKKVLLCRSVEDDRVFLTHSGVTDAAHPTIRLQSTETSHDVRQTELAESTADVIGIDEGQFVKDIDALAVLASLAGKQVIISALHASSESAMFPSIIKLIPHCDDIIKLNAVCTRCGSDVGNYTSYRGEKDSLIQVGGLDKYTALCRKCYFEEHPELEY